MKKLSILEFGEIAKCSEIDVLHNIIYLAGNAEDLKYTRLWLAEHHEQGMAWRSPEILLSILAGSTERIKLGSGGVLLPLTSPLRVAQNYKLLATLFPDRIDLGLAKGVTNNKNSILELLNGVPLTETILKHDQRVKNTIKFLKEDISRISDTDPIYNSPIGGAIPDIWILGSSGISMDLAIEEKSNYSFSLFHDTRTTIEQKRDLFVQFPERYFAVNKTVPKSNIAITVICGKTKAECDSIYVNHRGSLNVTIMGDKYQCLDFISKLFDEFKTDEIMIHFISNGLKNKKYCYEVFSKLIEMKDPEKKQKISI